MSRYAFSIALLRANRDNIVEASTRNVIRNLTAYLEKEYIAGIADETAAECGRRLIALYMEQLTPAIRRKCRKGVQKEIENLEALDD